MTSPHTQQTALSMPLFVSVTAGVFMLISLTLLAIDFYPEPVFSTQEYTNTKDVEKLLLSEEKVDEPIVTEERAVPTRIVIASIGVDTPIMSPESTDVNVLDRALQSGAVHYPGSGLLGERANMLLFGHSSYLPVVKNKAYQAFNEVGKLTPGDIILVYAEDTMYEYEVINVRMESASDVVVSFESPVPLLTLSTCNTFGAKEDRWVVTAKRV